MEQFSLFCQQSDRPWRLVALKRCGRRVLKITAAPLLPGDSSVSTLLAQKSHGDGHDGTLLKMRRMAWVVRRRRVAQKVVEGCLVFRLAGVMKGD